VLFVGLSTDQGMFVGLSTDQGKACCAQSSHISMSKHMIVFVHPIPHLSKIQSELSQLTFYHLASVNLLGSSFVFNHYCLWISARGVICCARIVPS